jgi:hypothetical protein
VSDLWLFQFDAFEKKLGRLGHKRGDVAHMDWGVCAECAIATVQNDAATLAPRAVQANNYAIRLLEQAAGLEPPSWDADQDASDASVIDFVLAHVVRGSMRRITRRKPFMTPNERRAAAAKVR